MLVMIYDAVGLDDGTCRAKPASYVGSGWTEARSLFSL